MAINKKLITFASKSVFTGANGINGATTATNGYYGNIPAYSIVFIKDTGEIWHNGKYISGGIWGTKQDNYVPLKIAGTEYNLSLNGHKQSYTTLTGSTSTANQAIVSSGTTNGWTLKTLGSRAFDSTSYLPLSGGTMLLGEGLKFHSDEHYFGTNCDARIISLLDSNGTTCDGGLIIDERATLNGTETVTELLRIRHSEFKWKGNVIYHAGNIPTWNQNTTGTAAGITGYSFKTLSSASTSGWTKNATDDKIIPTMSFMAYWNGAYSGTSSNLTYCSKGAFGTATTHAHTDYVTSITYDSSTKKLKQSKGDGTATDIVTFGSRAFDSTSYLPLSGGTVAGITIAKATHKGGYNVPVGWYRMAKFTGGNEGYANFTLYVAGYWNTAASPLGIFHITTRTSTISMMQVSGIYGFNITKLRVVYDSTNSCYYLDAYQSYANYNGGSAAMSPTSFMFVGECSVTPYSPTAVTTEEPTTYKELIIYSNTVVSDKFLGNLEGNADTATTAACLTTDNTMKLYAQYNNEVNFGGTSTSDTIFFGYRKTDSKPIPTTIVFGGNSGDSQVKAKSFIKNGGTASQFLMANGSVTTTKNLTTSTNIGWSSTTADALLVPTMNTLAFWNGAFNANGASNLKYSSNGVIIGANNYTSYTPIVNSASTHATKDTKIIAPTSTGTSGYVITANSSGYAQWTAPSSLGKVGDADTLDSKHASDFTNYYSWTATIQGQTWSRICLITSASTVTGSSMLINVRGTRGSVVYNNSYVLNVSHPAGGGSLSQIAGIDYSTIKIRVYSTNTAVYSVELYDDAYSISSSTTQTVACSIIPLTSDIIVTKYIAFTDGTTVASGYSLVAELTSTSGVDIITKSIMATTFTGSLTGHASLDLPLAGGWMDTDASINFKGSSSSTAKYASIGYAAKSISGLVMHTTSTPNATKALYIQSNGYDSSSDTGGLAIDNDCVTVFGAGDTGSVFRVLNEDNVGDGAQFAVTKASGATVKYGLSVGTTITAAGAVTASNVWDIISITKSLTVTTSWSDTGIVLNASTITSGTGTYAIQVSATSICNSTDLWPAIYSGVCSIYTSGTNHDTESDEIELHSAGHAAKKRLYLRILCCLGANAKLQIASDTNMSTAYNYVFKFKRLI